MSIAMGSAEEFNSKGEEFEAMPRNAMAQLKTTIASRGKWWLIGGI
jgi:hypothetical protein